MQNQAVGGPLAASSVPWLGGLSRPLAHLGPGQCLCLFRAEIKGRREAPSPLPRHTHAQEDINRVRVVPGLQTWGSSTLGAPLLPITVGWDPLLAEAGTAGQGEGGSFEQGSQGWGPEGWLSVADYLPCLTPQQRSLCSSRPLQLRARSCPRTPRAGRQACPSPCPLAR